MPEIFRIAAVAVDPERSRRLRGRIRPLDLHRSGGGMSIIRRFTTLCLAVLLAGSALASPARAAVDTDLTNFDTAGDQVVRFDTDGNAVDAHDGAITRFGSTYYLYGTSFDCGYQWQNNTTFCGFKVYSSPDLAHWTDRGHVVPPRDCRYCFRPHVVYDKATRKYVMWVNDQDAADKFRVYTSARPTGPFTEQAVPDLPDQTHCTADLDVFVDDDGTGYLACSNAGWHAASSPSPRAAPAASPHSP
jgi:hypothetical protein